jgi:inhibitor of KinA sporulation pathway (predicted exonuclease)
MDHSTLLVLDTKTTCWENSASQPAGQFTEIIKIDVAYVNTKELTIIEEEEIYVLPKKSKISSYCEKAYGVSQDVLNKKGIAFPEAYRRLLIHYMSKDRFCAGWGLYDKHILERHSKSYELETLFGHPYQNILHMFALMTGEDIEQLSLRDALSRTGLQEHKNNAINVSNLFIKMAKGLKPNFQKKSPVLTLIKSLN